MISNKDYTNLFYILCTYKIILNIISLTCLHQTIQHKLTPTFLSSFYVFVYLDINRGKPCLVNLILSKLFLTGSFYVCSANFILIRFNLIFFRKCLTSINPNIMSFNFKSSKCHALNITPR